MVFSESLQECLLDANASKALATSGPNGVNVVPVSAIQIADNNIFLYDFFMDKTRTNTQQETDVSLVAWVGLDGYQIKATCSYESCGQNFEDANEWCKQQFPTRTLQGVLVLSPTEIHNIGITNKV